METIILIWLIILTLSVLFVFGMIWFIINWLMETGAC